MPRAVFSIPFASGLLMMARVSASFGDVFSNVPEAADYQLIYQLDIPVTGGFRNATPVPYTIASSNGLPTFDRVAYYLELVTASGITNWVYASMDAFTTNASQLGLPHNVNNPVSFQRSVNNLTVFANVAGVQTGAFDSGNVEMWSADYNPTNAAAVFAASDLTYDWGDTINTNSDPGFGSFQIHNHEALQTVLAYNGWASGPADGNTNNDDVGIGSQPAGNPDWTYAANAANYVSRRLVILLRPQRFQVAFTAVPRNHQVTPRNRTTNTATVPVQGAESLGGFDAALLRVFRDGLQQGTDIVQPLTYTNGSALFSFIPQIAAELATYSFELYLRQGTNLFLARRVSDVVAGDVYLIYGQSNAEADMVQGSANGYASPWIRTFGEASDSAATTTNYLFWVQANGDGCRDTPAGVGQWPLVMARMVVDHYQIPLAVLNGSRGAYSIVQLQRDWLNPDNLSDGPNTNRVYDRLRCRAIQAGVSNAVRAIFYYQGESDFDNVVQHTNGFASLIRAWKVDYPAVERFFVTQIHVGCNVTRENPALRDAQRRFPDIYQNLRAMSANALPGHNGCHYLFSGYQQHGLNVYNQLARELYGAPDLPNIDPPNPLRVEFASPAGDRLRIVLRRSGDTLGVDPAALVDFALGGDGSLPISSSVTTTNIELQYARPVVGATTLAYLGHNFSAPGWITNANGVGLLAFSEPIINPFLQVRFLSPQTATNANPGQVLLLCAQATSPTGTVSRVELDVDGIPFAAANNTNYIAAWWTVPPAYSHRIVALAFDNSGNQAQQSTVIFAGLPSAPAGVTNGLSVWLRPETGILRNGQGLVTRWQDSSGQSNDCIQNSPAYQPAYVGRAFNELPGLLFTGSQYLAGTNGMSTGSYSKLVRFQLNSVSGNLLSAGPTTNVAHALYFGYMPSAALWHDAPFLTSSVPTTAFQPHVLTATYDGVTRTGVLYQDGVQVGASTAAKNNAEPSYQVGAYKSGYFMDGTIGEAIIYNRVLSSAERANVESYLVTQPQLPPTNALPAYWINTAVSAPQDWTAVTNWASSGGFPNASGAEVLVDANIPSSQAINLNAALTVGSLYVGGINGSAAYALLGNGGTLTFDNGPQPATLAQIVTSAGDTIAAPLLLNSSLVVANTSGNPLTLSGPISGPAAGLALNAGSVLLLGTNTYNGGTTVNNGTLLVNGSLASSPVAVVGGTLGGTGSIAAGVTVTTGGALSPGIGNIPGTLAIASGLTLSNADLYFHLANATNVGGGVNDLLALSGGPLNLSGVNVIHPNFLNDAVVNGTYTLISGGNATIGNTANLTWAGAPATRQTIGFDTSTAGMVFLNVTGSVASLVWQGANASTWDLDVTTNWLNGGVSDMFFNRDLVTFDDTSTNGNVFISGVVQPGRVAVTNTTLSYTFTGGVISGTARLIKSGSGTLVLANNNFYSGLTLVIGGALQIGTGSTNGTLGTNFVQNNAALVFNRSDAITYPGIISGAGSLTKSGAGTLTLVGANAYTGPTLINAGTLALVGSGSIANSVGIYLASGAVLDITGTSGGSMTLSAGQTFSGNGLVKGNLIVSGGATLAPGNPNGVLTVSSTLYTSGITLVHVSKSPLTNNVVQVSGTLTYGGTLMVTNIGTTPLAAGDGFKLFNALSYQGTFSSLLPATPGPGLLWDTSSLTADGTLKVVAQTVRNGPVLPPQTNLTTIGLAPITITNTASDVDIPPPVLTYVLAQAPTNAVIDTNGIITWTPAVAQVPSTNLFQTVVTDNGFPPLSATNGFTVFVQAVHNGPKLAFIADRIIHAGTKLIVSNSVTDSDVPAYPLIFSLDTPAPAGATINPTNGLFTWSTSDLLANTTNSFTVHVADTASPSLSDSRSFTVRVLPRPSFQSIAVSSNLLSITWSSIAGQTYRVQCRTNLNDTNWVVLLPDITATGPSATKIDLISTATQKYYRILLVP